MRPSERPRHLRLVTEIPPEPVFDWLKPPENLAAAVRVSREIVTQSTHLATGPELAATIHQALDNLAEALGGEVIGWQIADHPVAESFEPINTIYDQLKTAKARIDATEFPELNHAFDLALEKALPKIIALAERSSPGEFTRTNPAFQKVLRIYQQSPTLRDQISEQLPLPTKMENAGNWKVRAQEQAELDTIGEKLKKCTTTVELLARLYVVLGANPVYFNETLHSRRLLRPSEIIRGIIDYVKSVAIPPDDKQSALAKVGANRLDTIKTPLPNFGDFKTANIVIPEITREFAAFSQQLNKKTALTPTDCDSWPALVWFVNDQVDPERTFTFTKRDTGGKVGTIQVLKGEKVIMAVENASFNKATVYELPDALTTGHIKPADAFLIELRTRLQEILDT